jgi:hypothetical protein
MIIDKKITRDEILKVFGVPKNYKPKKISCFWQEFFIYFQRELLKDLTKKRR